MPDRTGLDWLHWKNYMIKVNLMTAIVLVAVILISVDY